MEMTNYSVISDILSDWLNCSSIYIRFTIYQQDVIMRSDSLLLWISPVTLKHYQKRKNIDFFYKCFFALTVDIKL